MSDCLHCDINQLIQERMEGGDHSLGDLASMVIESLADLILAAPEGERALLMADAMAHFGSMYLEKSGEGGPSGATH